jgi:hypothetical protein
MAAGVIGGSEPALESNPRYEFRVWAESLTELRMRLEALAAPDPASESDEIYLVSSATDQCNAKIRKGVMDIKILTRTERELEQWKPVLKADFPLNRLTIAGQIFPCLRLEPPQLAAPRYSIDDFLNQVVQRESKIAVARVSKRRVRFNPDRCQAEFAAVTIDHITADTVAVESEDADVVRQMMRRLGIEDRANTSYIRRVKQVLGV